MPWYTDAAGIARRTVAAEVALGRGTQSKATLIPGGSYYCALSSVNLIPDTREVA